MFSEDIVFRGVDMSDSIRHLKIQKANRITIRLYFRSGIKRFTYHAGDLKVIPDEYASAEFSHWRDYMHPGFLPKSTKVYAVARLFKNGREKTVRGKKPAIFSRIEPEMIGFEPDEEKMNREEDELRKSCLAAMR